MKALWCLLCMYIPTYLANEEVIETLAEYDGYVEKFDVDGIYPKRERRPSIEWWKNHIVT